MAAFSDTIQNRVRLMSLFVFNNFFLKLVPLLMVFVVVCFYISENINGKNKAHVKQFTIIHGTKPKVYMPTRRSSGQHTKVNSDDTSKSRLKLHTKASNSIL